MPLAMLIQHFEPISDGPVQVAWVGLAVNLLPVIARNLLGGSVLVGLTYPVIHRRGAAPEAVASAATPPSRNPQRRSLDLIE